LRLVQRPAEDKLREQPITAKGTAKDKTPMSRLARRFAFNERGSIFGSGQEREHAAAEQCQEIDPLVTGGQVKKVAGNDANENFDQGDRNSDPDRHKLAMRASAIQIAATNQTFEKTMFVALKLSQA